MTGKEIFQAIELSADVSRRMKNIMNDSNYRSNFNYEISGYVIEDIQKVASKLYEVLNEAEFNMGGTKKNNEIN